MTAINSAVAKQFAKFEEADAAAHIAWEKVEKEGRKLVRISKVGKKARVVIPISESRGVEIRNQFKGKDKVFAPAFARKWKFKAISLDND